MSLAFQMRRLARHSAIYGLGGIVSRILARPPAAALHALPPHGGLRPGRDRHRADGGARDRAQLRDLERVLPLLLRLEGRERPHPVVRTVVLVHDGDGDARARARLRVRDADRALARARQRSVARARGRGRAVGADELPAADEPVPRRGALGAVRDRERREHPDHGRRDVLFVVGLTRARPAPSSATSPARSSSTSRCSPTAASSSASSSTGRCSAR